MPKGTRSATMTPQKMHPENYVQKEKCIKEKQANFKQSIPQRENLIVWFQKTFIYYLHQGWLFGFYPPTPRIFNLASYFRARPSGKNLGASWPLVFRFGQSVSVKSVKS